MFRPEMYRLLDFGEGRRLESFGPWWLDRPCPAVREVPKARPDLWAHAHATFYRLDNQQGRWAERVELPQRWTIAFGPIVLELKRTGFGHLGVFPEQVPNWEWIASQVSGRKGPVRVLNLFGYTGGSTLAAAAAGAEVVHVDAARNVVAWARWNAELSGLAQAAIRWIVEDARKFVRRELRRGSTYDAVILDPPSYGHGAQGEVWRLSKHLPGLLEQCAQLTTGRRAFIVLSCHTPDFGPHRLARLLDRTMGTAQSGHVEAERMMLCTEDGRQLPSGVVVRWTCL